MKKLLMCGAAALMVLSMAGVANAQKMKLAPGEHCGRFDAEGHLLWGNIGAGQYVYVKWVEQTYEVNGTVSNNPGEPVFVPMGHGNTYNENNRIAATDYYDAKGWYMFEAPTTADYILTRYNTGYVPDRSIVSVCVFDEMIDTDRLL